MTERTDLPNVETPPRAKIAKATALALSVAGMLLVAVVLPAEYAIDPLGTGKALGLSELAQASEKTTAAAPPPAHSEASILPVLEPAIGGGAPRVKGAFITQPKRYMFDSREMELDPGEGLEIKYNMQKGAGLIYSWVATDKLTFEFHGEPKAKPPGQEENDYYESYELDDQVGKNEEHGTFLAPSTGVHGWYWENKTENVVKLSLISAGFYDWILQNRNNREKALKTMDPEMLPSHPRVPDVVLR